MKETKIYFDPILTDEIVFKACSEVINNIVYTQKSRKVRQGWAQHTVSELRNYLSTKRRPKCISVPSEAVPYLERKPTIGNIIKENYTPGCISSNNGRYLSVGKYVIASYVQKYGGIQKRRIRKITKSGIYFDGMHVPIPVGDTHRIYVVEE